MKITTSKFDKDVTVKIIEQNSHRVGRPRLRRKMCLIAEVSSSIKQLYVDSFNIYVGFSTRFRLYRGVREYYLQISGVSTNPKKCPNKNKIITFLDPEEFAEIASCDEDKRVFWSPLTEELIDLVFDTEYLTDFEKERWSEILYDD